MTDFRKTSTGGAAHPLDEKSISEFKTNLRGELIRPRDDGYDEARKVYNAMIDRRPAMIARCANVADAISAVNFARRNNLLVAIRGGGHSVPGFGTCDDGLVIDLSRMRGIRVDPARRTVRAEGGCTWGDLNHAAHAFGLATTGGVVSTTGIAGLTLGGGMGYLMRQCGLSCDNLVSADVVTADGRFVTCSEDKEQDLFWAIRGGGGNFGVVTSFEYRLHPVKEIYGGPTFFPLDGHVLRGFQDWILNAPEQMGALFAMTLAPPLPFIPDEWHGKPVSAVIACWNGSPAEGEELLKPTRQWAEVVGSFVGPMPYPVINTLFDELVPAGLQNYWKTNFTRAISDDAVEAHLDNAARTPCVQSGAFIYPFDGAIHRAAADETAFAYRDANFCTLIAGAWPDAADNERNTKWVRDYYEALRPYSEEGGYVNFMTDDDQSRIRDNYQQNYDRLVEVKKRYDPANLFRMNQNIEPSVTSV
ncbi:MAG TPA: FAD-binding oxidoreductase [Blastocatellia bacterium]|nr:FAD-binding oxidoreductase [Blastocatellia bacterium]